MTNATDNPDISQMSSIELDSEFSNTPFVPASLCEDVGKATRSGVVVYDQNCKSIFRNNIASELLGLPKDLIESGRPISDAIEFMCARNDFGENVSRDHIDSIIASIYDSTSTGKLTKNETFQRRPCGTVMKIEHVYTPEGFVVLLITEATKRTRSEKVLKIALESANAGYWSLNFKNNNVYFSDHIRSFFTEDEYSRCLKEGFWSILHPDDLSSCKRAWSKGFKSNTVFDFSYRVILEKTGITHFHTYVKPDYSNNGTPIGVTCFVSNVSKQVNELNALKLAKKEAEEALHARNDFLARLSHEIRTPMNGISGMAEAIMSNTQDKELNGQLSVIQKSAGNLLHILDGALEYARLGAKKIKICEEDNDPREMFSSVLALWEPKARVNNTKLSLHINPKLPKILYFDAFRVQQCLNNLLSNAIKFTENGTVQIIATYVKKDGYPPVFVMAVKDTGIGMTPEQQTHIFKPYEQADSTISQRYGGTGLGMTICKKFVDLMGGKIAVKSESSIGSTFIISIPEKNKAEASQPKLDRPDEQPLSASVETTSKPDNKIQALCEVEENRDTLLTPTGLEDSITAPIQEVTSTQKPQQSTVFTKLGEDQYKNLRVLVAEDNATNQIVIKALLSPLVGEMFFAENGIEALKILESNKIDVVLMDIHMPHMDGIETTLAIRNSKHQWKDVSIIALTADPEYQQKRICRNIGMNDAIAKPVSRRAVLDSFDEVLKETENNDFDLIVSTG